MRKIFQYLVNQFSDYSKIFFERRTKALEKQNPKTNTDYKAYLSMPMAFDFTAYFDDNELENNAEDISPENPTTDTDTEVYSTNDEKCNEKICLSNIQQYECCVN